MNKLFLLSLLVVCAAVVAGARGKKRRQSVEENLEAFEDIGNAVETAGRRGKKGRRQNSGIAVDVEAIVENAEIEGTANLGGRSRRLRNGRGDFTTTEFFSTTTPYVPTTRMPLRRRGNGIQGGQRVLNRRTGAGGAGEEVGGFQGAVAQSSLKAGEKNLDALQALLQKKQARQERINAKAEKKARRKEAARTAAGERLAASKAVDFETYEQAEDFHDLTAEASKDIQNDFALQIMSSNSHKEDAAISESSGSSYASGTALQLEESVDAEKFAEEEVLSESESVDNELLDAEQTSEDLLNAQEASKVENEATIDAQNFQQASHGFRESDDFFGSQGIGSNANPFGGSGNIFGNNAFGSPFNRK
ncbi:uncharacterized protein [Watersipora subatra]|uniref:uncharacterized protein n=1 Tax=Watersipora subatra TaxID=2589382 RepID=UPI00355BB1B4